jgi:heme/copper-type cytochrome/quinol oxidase subunit 2
MGALETILTIIAIFIVVLVGVVPFEIISRLYDMSNKEKRK